MNNRHKHHTAPHYHYVQGKGVSMNASFNHSLNYILLAAFILFAVYCLFWFSQHKQSDAVTHLFSDAFANQSPKIALEEEEALLETVADVLPAFHPASKIQPLAVPVVVEAPAVTYQTLHITIEAGMSLSTIFQNNQLSPQDLHKILAIKGYKDILYNLHVGQSIRLEIDDARQILSLVLTMDIDKQLSIQRHASKNPVSFSAQIKEIVLEKRMHTVSGRIEKSLAVDGIQAGLSSEQVNRLDEIFQQHLAIARVLQAGDQFAVYFDEFFLAGKSVKVGDIVAAEIINQGKLYQVSSELNAQGKRAYHVSVFTLANEDLLANNLSD